MHFLLRKIIGCAGELQKIIFEYKFSFDLTMKFFARLNPNPRHKRCF